MTKRNVFVGLLFATGLAALIYARRLADVSDAWWWTLLPWMVIVFCWIYLIRRLRRQRRLQDEAD